MLVQYVMNRTGIFFLISLQFLAENAFLILLSLKNKNNIIVLLEKKKTNITLKMLQFKLSAKVYAWTKTVIAKNPIG